MDTELNFLGIRVADWQASYRFYADILGMHSELAPKLGVWASLGGGWDDYRAGSGSIIVELFDGGRPPGGERAWGREQAIRPSIHVDDLQAAVEEARARGVPFTGGVEDTTWGKRMEFTAPDGIRWTLAEAPGYPSNSDVSRPYIGHVEIKAHDLAGQKAFYREIMGMGLERESPAEVILGQGSGKPWLVLESGGERPINDPRWASRPVIGHPIFISYMAGDIRAVVARLQAARATVLRDLRHHADWGGTDMIIADADGNALQIVQYGTSLDT